MNRTTTLSVVLLVSAIFTGSMLSAHARPVEPSSAVSSASQGNGDDDAEQAGYWRIWATETAQ